MRASWIAFTSLSFLACATTGESGDEIDGGGNGGNGGGTSVNGGGNAGNGDTDPSAYPKTCTEAAEIDSYIGCDFWPTVTANPVWEEFDFTVVVANAGDEEAQVVVKQGNATITSANVSPNSLTKLYLPWVPGLKGPEFDVCGMASYPDESMFVAGSAYHLTSSVPVTAYQFSALEYTGVGGPAGKSWSGCPGHQTCAAADRPVGCFSFSNDASLLLPTSTLTTNYRVVSPPGLGTSDFGVGPTLTVTATEDGTDVTVQASLLGGIAAGGKVTSEILPGQIGSFTLNAGDVAQMVGTAGADLSGSLVQSTKPVQVIAGIPCVQTPSGTAACDHIEESVFPAETLGTRYFVTRPTGPSGSAVQHVVKIYGNVDGTSLTYPAGAPSGAPSSINAGQVADLGVVSQDFEVSGTSEFGVGMFMVGAEMLGGQIGTAPGDPSLTLASSVEQYRTKYVFLAPDDYDASYVDIVMPMSAAVTLDGSQVPAPAAIGNTGFGVSRAQLSNGGGGHHVLTSDEAVGIQVMGYGAYTSYHYPGGLDLQAIAPPPPPIN